MCDFASEGAFFRLNTGITRVQASVAEKTWGLCVLLGVSIEPRPRRGWLAGFSGSKVGGMEGRFCHFD